ncbi:hypothetical protein ACHAWT_008395 [Skeletonema menzelii]
MKNHFMQYWYSSSADQALGKVHNDGSKLAKVINENIQAGKIVPSEITTQLIYNAKVELRQGNHHLTKSNPSPPPNRTIGLKRRMTPICTLTKMTEVKMADKPTTMASYHPIQAKELW